MNLSNTEIQALAAEKIAEQQRLWRLRLEKAGATVVQDEVMFTMDRDIHAIIAAAHLDITYEEMMTRLQEKEPEAVRYRNLAKLQNFYGMPMLTELPTPLKHISGSASFWSKK